MAKYDRAPTLLRERLIGEGPGPIRGRKTTLRLNDMEVTAIARAARVIGISPARLIRESAMAVAHKTLATPPKRRKV